MAGKDPTSPATTSDAYDRMLPSWCKIQAVLEGTEALRAAGTEYLPQHTNEAITTYSERLACATLFNMTKLTLDSWVGRPFGEPIGFDEVPPQIQTLLDDVDLLGNDIHVFARNWFSDGIAKAFSHVLVDFPRVEEGAVRTLADDQSDNLRPYWVAVAPEQLFFASVDIVKGVEQLREVRIRESVPIRDGFSEYEIPQIRRIYLTEEGSIVEIYHEKKSRKKKPEWELVDWYSFSLPFIPLVTFYANRQGAFLGKSPLEDLVDLNIAHWQSTSDQRACLTVARFPLLALSGGTDDNQKLVIGPNRWLWCPDTQGRYYYVEHTGAALEAGREDLRELERQMGDYGAEFLKKRPDRETAAARTLDTAEATSALQDMTRRFADAMTLALYYTGVWMRLERTGKVLLSTEFGAETSSPAELQVLGTTRRERDISRRAYLKELKRRCILTDEYDIEADATELEAEALSLFGGSVGDEDAFQKDSEGEE